MPNLTRRATLASAALAVAVPRAGDATAQPAAPPPLRPVPSGEAPLFGARHWTLPNGLRVAFVHSRRVPVVTQHLFYAAGSGEDPAGRSGLAHFLEHMMFKGSRNVPSGAISLAVAREGGSDNAFTSLDVTAYHQQVEASRLPLIANLEADRFAEPLLGADELEPERQVVLEERRLRVDSVPRGRFREAFEAALWGPQHWHGRPIIGWEDEIRAITRDDMVAFRDSRYAPANAVLVVTGDVEEAQLREVVEARYGVVPARPAAPRDRAPAPAAAHEPRLVRRDPGVRDAAFLRAWMAPSLTGGAPPAAGPEHAYPLEVLAHLLGSGPGSRLHRALVETGLAVAAGSYYGADGVGATDLTLQATPQRGTAPERLERAAGDVVKALLDEGPTEAEVARSIRQITAGALLSLDGIGAAPRMLGGALAIGLPADEVEYWPARIRAVTAPQVAAAARAVLGACPDAVGWLLPEGAA